MEKIKTKIFNKSQFILFLSVLIIFIVFLIAINHSISLQAYPKNTQGLADYETFKSQCNSLCELALNEIDKKLSLYCTNRYNIAKIGNNVGCQDIPEISCRGVDEYCN